MGAVEGPSGAQMGAQECPDEKFRNSGCHFETAKAPKEPGSGAQEQPKRKSALVHNPAQKLGSSARPGGMREPSLETLVSLIRLYKATETKSNTALRPQGARRIQSLRAFRRARDSEEVNRMDDSSRGIEASQDHGDKDKREERRQQRGMRE